MQLYANQMTIDALMREFAYAFADKKYPGVPNLELNSITLEPFSIGDISIAKKLNYPQNKFLSKNFMSVLS